MTPTEATSPRSGMLSGRVLLGAAVISWACLMAPVLTAGPLVLDEFCSYWAIDAEVPGTVWQRSLEIAAVPPLSCWIQQTFLGVLGKSEWAFRLPSLLAFLGAIFMTYVVGKNLAGEFTGGIAALILTWHPEAMDEVRIGRCYGLVLLLAATVVWTSLRWLKTPERGTWALGWSLASIALMWTHYTAVFLVIVTGVVMALEVVRSQSQNRRVWLALGIAFGTLVIACLPLRAPLERLQAQGPYLNFSPAGVSLWSLVGPLWWMGIPAGLVLRRLSKPGLYQSVVKNRHFWLMGACALLPLVLLGAMASDSLSSLANPRYRVAYAPAGALFLTLLVSSDHAARRSLLTTVCLLIAAWVSGNSSPWTPSRLGFQADKDWFQLSQTLKPEAQPGEALYVQGGLVESMLVPAYSDDLAYLEYVACRLGRFYVETSHPRYGLPFLWRPETGVIDRFQKRLHEGPDVIWVAVATDTDLNRHSLSGFQSLVALSGFKQQAEYTWHNAVLLKYSRGSPEP